MHAVEPRLEVLFGIDEYAEAHVGVRDPAELGALAVEDARFCADHPYEVVVERDHGDLTVDLRNPEDVDDILRGEFEGNRTVDRDVQLVRGNDFMIGVPEFKPPLVSNCFHVQNLAVVGGYAALLTPDLTQRRDGDCDENNGRDNRPCDFELSVSMRLVRELVGVGAAPVSNGYVDNGTFDENKYNGCNPENEYEQVRLVFSNRPGGTERGLGVVGRTRCQEGYCDRGEQ